jgi:hypothetical protein
MGHVTGHSEWKSLTADPRVAVRAAWQLALDEGQWERAELLERLKDAGAKPTEKRANVDTDAGGGGDGGDTPALPTVEEGKRNREATAAAPPKNAAASVTAAAAPAPAVASTVAAIAAAAAAATAAAAAAAAPSSFTPSHAQLTQLQAQLAAFRRLARGLTVPLPLMATATTNPNTSDRVGDDRDGGGIPAMMACFATATAARSALAGPTSVSSPADAPSSFLASTSSASASHPVGTSLARRRQRQRLVDSQVAARVIAIAILPLTLPDEVRRAAAIESKALRLLALQRKVRYQVAMEPRLTHACSASGALLDSRLNRRSTDPTTYVETITRGEAMKMQLQQQQANAAEEKKLKARQHSQQVMAVAKANQRRMEETRRVEAKRRQEETDAAKRAQAALLAARRREHDARVAVIAERRRWLAQLLQHGRDNKDSERADRLRQKRRNDGVVAFHRKCQNGLRREERERIQALRAGDEEAYMRLVQDSKNQRIEELLHTTDDLLKHLADRIENMKAAAVRASDDPDLLDDDELGSDGGGSVGAGAAMAGAGLCGSGDGVGDESKTEVAGGSSSGGGGGGADAGANAGAEESPTKSPLPKTKTSAEGGDGSGGGAVTSPERFSGIRQYSKLAHGAQQEEILVQPSILVGPNGAGEMRSYQLAGLQWMISLHNNNLNGILADEMGLGKTIQCISLFAYLAEVKGNRGPHLVLAPKAVLPNWAREFRIWYPDCEVVMYDGSKEARKALREERVSPGKFSVLLTHYDLVMYDKAWLSKVAWDYIVVDEGHRLKNHQSKLSCVLQAAYTAKHRLLLTGTPIQNNLTELWALLNFLLPSVFNSSEGFEMWFNAPFSANKAAKVWEGIRRD